MAATVTETQTFALPPEEVFDYLVDFSNLADWDPMFDRSRRLDDSAGPDGAAPVQVGTRFEVVADKAGVEVPIVYTVETCDRPHTARLVGEGDGFTSIDELEVRATDDGSELTWHARVETDTPAVDTLATPVFKAVAKASMAGLRDTLGR